MTSMLGVLVAIGTDKLFDASASKPKLYVVDLAMEDRVLQTLSVAETVLPVIYHWTPEAYYRVLFRLRRVADVQALQDMLDRSENVWAMRGTHSHFRASWGPCTAWGSLTHDPCTPGRNRAAVWSAPLREPQTHTNLTTWLWLAVSASLRHCP